MARGPRDASLRHQEPETCGRTPRQGTHGFAHALRSRGGAAARHRRRKSLSRLRTVAIGVTGTHRDRAGTPRKVACPAHVPRDRDRPTTARRGPPKSLHAGGDGPAIARAIRPDPCAKARGRRQRDARARSRLQGRRDRHARLVNDMPARRRDSRFTEVLLGRLPHQPEVCQPFPRLARVPARGDRDTLHRGHQLRCADRGGVSCAPRTCPDPPREARRACRAVTVGCRRCRMNTAQARATKRRPTKPKCATLGAR